ncbi:hypothetical protein INT47_001595 [Mucor saturninus]|uniref:TauD/TfdA-like domain-containing protein n=1 Tax=Mucor saturninus TaxID=64648 RepID=A0A8H7QHD3_9FUNG|nr:hypothetical protein INT47_001595 [Mucor saturninus]
MPPTAQLQNSTQPDISYLPNRKKYEDRVACRLAQEDLKKDLPAFPAQLFGPKVWKGSDYEGKETEWIYQLTEKELLEIDEATECFDATGKPLGEISKETFPLPTFGTKIKKLIEDDVLDGRGFIVVRGINPDKYTVHQNMIAYTGICAHVGKRGKQGQHVISHIRDIVTNNKNPVDFPIQNASYTNDIQVYHTDAGDIVSLYAINAGETGGKSRIASNWTVYNELAKNRPDLIHVLSKDWPHQINDSKDCHVLHRPLLYYLDEKIIFQYARFFFTGFGDHPRREDIPPISEAQAEALDALHFTAEKFNLGLQFQKGDMQFINNLSIFHARDSYTDSEKNVRHLLRHWIHPENAWELPCHLQPTWDNLFFNEREEVFPEGPAFRLF